MSFWVQLYKENIFRFSTSVLVFMSFSGVWESYALTHTKVYFAFLFFDDEHFL